MWKKQFQAYAKYNRNMNEKLYSFAAQLSPEMRNENRGAFFKSIEGTLQHIMVADLAWLRRFTLIPGKGDLLSPLGSYPPLQNLGDKLYPTFDELARARMSLDELITHFIDSTDDSLYGETLKYRNMAGETHENFLWVLFTHFFNHQTHHRGQASTLFFQAGVDVGVTDFPVIIK